MPDTQGFPIFKKHLFEFSDIICSQLVIREVQVMQGLIVAKRINKEVDFKLIEITPCNWKMAQSFIADDWIDENWWKGIFGIKPIVIKNKVNKLFVMP